MTELITKILGILCNTRKMQWRQVMVEFIGASSLINMSVLETAPQADLIRREHGKIVHYRHECDFY